MNINRRVPLFALGLFAMTIAGSYPQATVGVESRSLVLGPPLSNHAVFDLSGWRWSVQNASRPWSTRIVVNRVNAIAFEVRGGDHIGGVKRNNRAEVLLANKQKDRIIPYDVDFWAAGAVAIQGAPSADAVPVIIAQVHDTPDVGEFQSKSPPFALRLQGRDLLLTVQGDPAAISLRNSRQQRLARIPDVPRSAIDATPVFHQWVARLRFSRTTEGEVDFWWDGKQVCSEKNLTMGYNNTIGGYWKHGLYRSVAAPERLRVIHANVEVGRTSLLGRIRKPLTLR